MAILANRHLWLINQRAQTMDIDIWHTFENHHNIAAFTKSLASEQSRDITFAALVPWFQIQTLGLTQTPTT